MVGRVFGQRLAPARPCAGAIIALAALLVPAACSRGGGSPPGPDVVLIVIDTLRADHLGCYGYPRPTSPRIDAFARSAALYTRAVSTAPWTLPAHASMFTGKYPFEHGAHKLRVGPRPDNASPLVESEETLAEALRAEGYQTAAFACNQVYLGRWTKLDQGFDTYVVEHLKAAEMNERIFGWLAQRDAARPFFLFVNYMDTHRPYNSSPRPEVVDPPPEGNPGKLLSELLEQVMRGGTTSEDLRQRVIDHYDLAVANADEAVGRLLDQLAQQGLLERALVIVTSDHGEYFGEHQLVEHAKDVYQPAVHVPLLVKRPGQRAAARSDELVTSVAVPELVFAALPRSAGERHRGLLENASGRHLPIAENPFSRTRDADGRPQGWRLHRARTAAYEWPLKYIRSSDGRDELYDLERDPGELEDLAQVRPDAAAQLRRRLAAFEASRVRAAPPAGGQPVEFSAEERRLMRELGYAGEGSGDEEP